MNRTARPRSPDTATLWKRWLLRHAVAGPWVLFLAWALAIGGIAAGAWRFSAGMAAVLATLTAGIAFGRFWVRWQREHAIREAPLPAFLRRKLQAVHPHLSLKDCDLVERGLRQFFMACLRSRKKFVAMPSQAVDTLWHEFILHTRAYGDWCELTLGRFLHHTPAEVLGRHGPQNDGLRRAWFWACREEAIQPLKPVRLPLLFALDAKFGIAGGFHYVPDCSGVRRDDGSGTVHCGTSFSDTGYAGDASGMGGVDTSDAGGFGGADGGGGGDGGGDGGGGCSSGCGGGGGD
jgi:hypothetical protein